MSSKKRRSENKVSPKKRDEIRRAAFRLLEIDSIDRCLALPPDRRTNFLRKKIGIVGTAL
jgi:hypothetical protein